MMITRLSQSGFQCARDCKRKYNYRYNMKLRKRIGFSGALNFGKLWHELLAWWYTLRMTDCSRAHQEIDYKIDSIADDIDVSHRLKAMLLGYIERWPIMPEMSLHEQSIEVDIRNPKTSRKSQRFTQFGIIDMLALVEKDVWLFEHKTAASVDEKYIEKLYSDSQITGYIAALRDMGINVVGVVYDIAKKPRIRQRKNEDIDDFYTRIYEWHKQNDSYHREEIIVPERQIADWREDVWMVTQEILAARRADMWPRNTGRCFDYHSRCEFLDLCQNGAPEALINAEYETRESPSDSHNETEKPAW